MNFDSWFQAQRDPNLDSRWAEDEPPPVFQTRVAASAWQRAERRLLTWVRRYGPSRIVSSGPTGPGVGGAYAAQLQIIRCLDDHWPDRPSGFVYVMEAAHEPVPGEERVKIGFSADPEARLKQVQTGCPFKLRLGIALPGAPEQERALHELCAAQREQGEWFRYEGLVPHLAHSMHALGLAWADEVSWT